MFIFTCVILWLALVPGSFFVLLYASLCFFVLLCASLCFFVLLCASLCFFVLHCDSMVGGRSAFLLLQPKSPAVVSPWKLLCASLCFIVTPRWAVEVIFHSYSPNLQLMSVYSRLADSP